MLDEAYIHIAGAPFCSDLVAKDKDIIILRTFSKIYGMAGLRAGAAFGRPDLLDEDHARTQSGALPVTGMAAATASLKSKTVVPERRKIIGGVRDDVLQLPGQAQLQVRAFGLQQIHGGREAAGRRNQRRDGEGEGLHRPRVAELAHLRSRLDRHAGGDEQVQDGVP